jgi:hypothetical protein
VGVKINKARGNEIMKSGKNMTVAHLEAVMAAMPEKMDAAELCALTLTIHSSYLDTQVEIISALISTVYTYGASQGISNEAISHGLRLCADLHDEQSTNKTTH